jgi:hypothetical protein
LEKLIRQWTDYRGLVLTRLGAGDVKPSEERSFLNLKGQLAEALANLTGKLSHTVAQDANSHLRAMNSLLNRYPTLYSDAPLETKAREDFEREWHDHFLFFNKLKGMQGKSDAQETRAPGTPLAVGALAVSGAETIHRRTAGARMPTVVLRLAILVGAVWLVVTIIPWHRFGSGAPGASGVSVKGFFSTVWDSMKETAANVNVTGGFMRPVVDKYGPEATLVLMALLLLALGYIIFVRMK